MSPPTVVQRADAPLQALMSALPRDVTPIAVPPQARQPQAALASRPLPHAIASADELANALRAHDRRPTVRLGEFLVKAGLVSKEHLDIALGVQAKDRRRRLGAILVEMGAVTTRQIHMALSERLGIPYVNVRDFAIDGATLRLVGASQAIQHQVLPLMRTGDALVVAMENPLGVDYSLSLRFTTGLRVIPVIADPEELRLRVAAEYPTTGSQRAAAASGRNAGKASARDVAALAAQAGQQAAVESDEADSAVSDNALVRLVNKIIIEAHAQGASDIHIESNPRTAHTLVRFRKDGELEEYLDLQSSFRNSLVSRIKIMAGLDISERRIAQDGKIDFSRVGPLAIELRVATIPTANGLEDVVLRILSGGEPLPLAALGLAGQDLTRVRAMVGRSQGLFLTCGPTGSGKTTTLHSLLHSINRPDVKIWTAEDPIEITQPGLRQVQINASAGWTFAAAMRSFLRADPDVIMVGEMRDAETARTAIEASLTGHMVMSTLHTNSAAESVVRLLDLGMDPFNFADAFVGVLAQRLVRKLCPHCRRRRVLNAVELGQLVDDYCTGTTLNPALLLADWGQRFAFGRELALWEAVGCEECKRGYEGRVGIYELLPGTPAIKDLVRSRATVPQLVEAARRDGMRTLRQDAIEKALTGAIDMTSARAACS